MRTDQSPELARAVQRIAKLNSQAKDIGFEIHQIADQVFDKGLVRAPNHAGARKILKRLAKDSALDELEREELRLIEESIDECRAALGLLADLPLGEAAQFKANGKANGHAEAPPPAEKRARGRPRGARNKPKSQAEDWSRPLRVEPEPPDLPDAA